MPIDTLTDRNLETAIERFLARNFPQIDMHGGSAGIEGIDHETGEVWISLGGACSGCGISPLTVSALQSRLVAEFDEISRVHASADGDIGDARRPDLSDVPF
jgi:Fe-S cluster biogenesis protein NfuA